MPALPTNQYENVIRHIKQARMDHVTLLERASNKRLDELSTAVDKTKSVAGIPHTTGQSNSYSIIQWMQGVVAGEVTAVAQLVAINATCHWRIDG